MMLEDNFTEFDRIIRSAMEAAEEEVPAGVWSRVSEHLDAWVAPLAGAAGASAAASSASSGTAASSAGTAASSAGTATSAGTGAAASTAGAAGTATAATASHVVTAVVVSTLAVSTGVGSYFVLKNSAEPAPEPVAVSEYVQPSPEVTPADTIDFVTAVQYVFRPVPAVSDPAVEPEPVVPETLDEVEPVRERIPEQTLHPAPECRRAEPVAKDRIVSVDFHLAPEFAGVVSGLAPAAMQVRYSGYEDRNILIEQDGASSFKMPVTYGVGLRFYLSRRWSVGAGLNYTELERTFRGSYSYLNPDVTSPEAVKTTFDNKQVYVGVPVAVCYELYQTPKWNFYGYAGGMLEKCLYDRYRARSAGSDAAVYFNREVKDLQTSINLGFGLEYRPFRHFSLYVSPGLRYYLSGDQPESIRTNQPFRFNAEFGLRFSL